MAYLKNQVPLVLPEGNKKKFNACLFTPTGLRIWESVLLRHNRLRHNTNIAVQPLNRDLL
jgi:hypothetical protein